MKIHHTNEERFAMSKLSMFFEHLCQQSLVHPARGPWRPWM